MNSVRKNLAILSLLCTFLLSQCGCRTLGTNGAAIGGMGALTGTMLGAAIGSTEGKAGEGALVGGLAGAVAGTAIGDSIDQQQNRIRALELGQMDAMRQQALSFDDIIGLSQSGLGSDVIVSQIQAQGLRSQPRPGNLIALKNAGVSESVIRACQDHFRQPRPSVRPTGYEVVEFYGPQPPTSANVLVVPPVAPQFCPPRRVRPRTRHFGMHFGF